MQIAQHAIQIKNGIMKHVNVSVKIIILAKKNIVGILACVFVRITSIKKSITDNSVISCDKIIWILYQPK